MKKSFPFLLVSFLLLSIPLQAQPSVVPEGVRFVYEDGAAQFVSLVGDFNSWSPTATPMKKTGSGSWNATVALLPGSYQYAFLVDNQRIQRDPANVLTFEAIDGSRINSLVTITGANKLVTEGYPVRRNLNDSYQKTGGTVYLNLVFKHHVPLYYNPKVDCIEAPFVRMHATRDYFEMGDVIQRYPYVHATVALSPTMLWQIQEIYVKRMEPFVKKNKSMRAKPATMDGKGFLARMRGKTDPWIDVCLTPADKLTDKDKALLYKNQWNAFTISPVRMHRFPELMRLYEMWVDAKGNPEYSVQDLRTLKFFSIFAHFDTEFFERNVPLIQTGTRILRSLDLRDLVSYRSDGKYYLKREITEADCERVVASSWMIMASILPNFEKVKYNPKSKFGQMELAATSFADANLPLVINSDAAKAANPEADVKTQYAHPEDADAQLKMAIAAYQTYFNVTPTGYIPPYGAISPAVLPILKKNGFEWFTSDEKVLKKSAPADLTVAAPYTVKSGDASLLGAFSNGLLGNRINWVYRNYYAENAANDFIETLLSFAPAEDSKKDPLVTIVIDNDDAWMNYDRDTDGKGLINGVYRKLNKLFETRTIVSVTMSEYMTGNRDRGVPAHKSDDLATVTELGSGSRLDGNFNAWIGETGSNAAWSHVAEARGLVAKGAAPVTGPEYLANLGTSAWPLFFGSTSEHWFQILGNSSVLGVEPKPYEREFLGMLSNAAEKSGSPYVPTSFIAEKSMAPVWEKPKKTTHVTFLVKLVDREAITAVMIAGNRKELANLEPNSIRLWDNGENGDEVFGNNVWTFVTDIEEGDLIYKFTNSGGQGTWEGSEAFPDVWRKVKIEGDKMTVSDTFAKLKAN
jgi:alpha-amylase/alpha-mannosidase (GH57 family)